MMKRKAMSKMMKGFEKNLCKEMAEKVLLGVVKNICHLNVIKRHVDFSLKMDHLKCCFFIKFFDNTVEFHILFRGNNRKCIFI